MAATSSLVLAKDKCLEDALVQVEVGLNDHHVLGKPVVAVLLEVIADHDFVPVLVHHARVLKVVRGGELQEQIGGVLPENPLDGVLPTFKKLSFTFGLRVQVVRLVGDQDDLVLAEILERDRVFLLGRQVTVEFLDRREADVDIPGIDGLEVLDRRDPDVLIADDDVGHEKELRRLRIQEVVPRLLDDVCRVDEEQEVP